MVILDAFALVAFARDEPAAGEVERLLREETTAVTSVNYAEALDRLIRVRGAGESRARAALDPLIAELMTRLDVTFDMARRAALIRSRHYHRSRSPLSLADCVCLAAAGSQDAIATADAPLLAAAEAEGIATVAIT